jgi:hypothetical protein
MLSVKQRRFFACIPVMHICTAQGSFFSGFQKGCAAEATVAAVDVEIKPLTIEDLAGFMRLTVKDAIPALLAAHYTNICAICGSCCLK